MILELLHFLTHQQLQYHSGFHLFVYNASGAVVKDLPLYVSWNKGIYYIYKFCQNHTNVFKKLLITDCWLFC